MSDYKNKKFKINKELADDSADQLLHDLCKDLIGYDVGANKNNTDGLLAGYRYLENIISQMPCYVFWKNKDFVYLGCNDLTADLVNLQSRKDIIGKTDYDFGWDKEKVDDFRKTDETIIRTAEPQLDVEDIVTDKLGKKIILSVNKMPIFNEKDEVIGIVGVSIDITDRKRAEALQLETERQKAHIEEQAKLVEVASQVSHDMRSPVGGLECTIKESKEYLPENLRIKFNDSLTKLQNLSGYLTSFRRKLLLEKQDAELLQEQRQISVQEEQKQEVILQLELLQALLEKRYLHGSTIAFEHEFAPNTELLCIEALPSDIYRMLSNILNNSIQALSDKKDAEIVIRLEVEGERAKIIIQDNGKGMPEKVLNKLRNKIAVTHGKEDGHGIGMGQVRKALEDNEGTIEIESQVGKGTAITLTFPLIPTPAWLVTDVLITKGDTVVVLDDDPSIHGIWDSKFKDYKQVVDVIHFTNGEETIDFINSGKIDKDKVILLTDYELVSQKLNGLDVVEQTQIPNTFLVTSHFDNLEIRQGIIRENIKLVPKQMATDIVIREIETKPNETKVSKKSTKKAKVVILEDDSTLADGLQGILVKGGKPADVYINGASLLENFAQYSKDTKFCLDYKVGSITGLEVAKVLHEAGYKKLYLLTGYDEDMLREMVDVPSYIIKILSKTDIDGVIEVLSS